MKSVIYIALGGAIGALLRYGFGLMLKPNNHLSFPMHTFIINALGCLAIGVIAAYAIKTNHSHIVTQFVIIGILGGFTTFSSFMLETMQLLKNGKTVLALTYLLGSNFIGLVAIIIGFQLHNLFTKA